MGKLTVSEILEATGGVLVSGKAEAEITGIETDSRKAGEESLFVPVIGERVDGHRFIPQAFKAGAAAALSSEKIAPDLIKEHPEKSLIQVEDTVQALQAIGAYYRSRLSIPVIGVTGSVGKTTAREMIACALTGGFEKVFKTAGNHNSQVGVPITLFEIQPDDEIAVLELGMSEPGEMERIASTARVDMAAVTNIGIAHIGQLGSQENICREKLKIQEGMREGGILFLNGDDPILKNQKAREGLKTIYFGTGENCQYRAVDIGAEEGFPVFTAHCPDGAKTQVRLGVLGSHNILNGILSIAVACENGVKPADAAKALQSFAGYKGRQQIFETGTITVIDDSYNASPVSMKGGLEVLMKIHPGKRKIAVLADMKELGEKEALYHREVGTYIGEHFSHHMADQLFLLGELAEEIGKGVIATAPEAETAIHLFQDKEELETELKKSLQPQDCVLFKGSNCMGLGDIASRFAAEGLKKAE